MATPMSTPAGGGASMTPQAFPGFFPAGSPFPNTGGGGAGTALGPQSWIPSSQGLGQGGLNMFNSALGSLGPANGQSYGPAPTDMGPIGPSGTQGFSMFKHLHPDFFRAQETNPYMQQRNAMMSTYLNRPMAQAPPAHQPRTNVGARNAFNPYLARGGGAP